MERFTNFEIQEIGKIYTPFLEPKGVPIQPSFEKKYWGKIIIYPEFEKGIKDLDGFSHIILLYYFHLSPYTSLEVVPYLDTELRGVFATRAPVRPNHIGLSIVELISIEKNIMNIQGVDMINETPLLDIKPYVGGFDIPNFSLETIRIGWLEKFIEDSKKRVADTRFQR